MNKTLTIALGLLAVGAAHLQNPSRQDKEVLAFRHVNVLSMASERVLENRLVVVRDGVIISVEDASTSAAPEGARIVEGRGQFLMPSFVDTHVHLRDIGDFDTYLAYGVGAVRNLWGAPFHVTLAESIRLGIVKGPELFTSGPYVRTASVSTPAQAKSVVAEHARLGYDYIKIHGSLSLDVLAALGEAAAARGIPIVGHVPRDQNLLDVLETATMAEISHAEEYLYTYFNSIAAEDRNARIPDAAAATLASGVAVTPTLVTYRSIARQVADLDSELERIPMRLASPFSRRSWQPSRNRYRRSFKTSDQEWLFEYLELQQRLVKQLHDDGVVLLTGTDANNPACLPGYALHEELEILVESGLSTFAALEAATIRGWRFLTGGEDVGTVEPGQRAELVLLNANPLEDIENTRKIAGIVRDGVLYTIEELAARVDENEARYEEEEPFVYKLWDNTIEDAERFYRERKAQNPDAFVFRPAAMVAQVLSSIRDGAPDAGLEGVRLLLEEYPDYHLALVLRGDLHQVQGDVEAARKSYSEALRHLPGLESVRRRLELLER